MCFIDSLEELPKIASGAKSKLIIPSKINFETIDFFLYFPGDQLKVIPTDFTTKTLKIEIKKEENNLFVCQAKKDFYFASSIYGEISNDWKKSKIKIQGLMKEINLYFILVNDYRSGDTGKEVSTFDKFNPENSEKKEEAKKGEKEKIEKIEKIEKKEKKKIKEKKEIKEKTKTRNF